MPQRRPVCRTTILQFLNAWVQKIRALGVGELCMAPCGWIRANGTGHTVVFVVMRQAEAFFSVSVINPSGEGTEYHAQEADPAKGKVSRSCCLYGGDGGGVDRLAHF